METSTCRAEGRESDRGDARSGAAVLLWCVSDSALATLAEAARTRSARVTAQDFDHFFDRQMVRLAEPGFQRPLSVKMLMDDLAVIPDRAESLLAGKLQDMDGEVRCAARVTVLEVERASGGIIQPHRVIAFARPVAPTL